MVVSEWNEKKGSLAFQRKVQGINAVQSFRRREMMLLFLCDMKNFAAHSFYECE